jgi:hypothetical protein
MSFNRRKQMKNRLLPVGLTIGLLVASAVWFCFFGGGFASASPTPTPVPMQTSWEHRVEFHESGFNQFGQGSWELVAAVPMVTHEETQPADAYGPPVKKHVVDRMAYYFKRRLP